MGRAKVSDTAKVNSYFKMKEVRALLPPTIRYVKFLWDAKPEKDTEILSLYAVKGNRKNSAPIQGDVIVDAAQQYDQLGINPEVFYDNE